MAAYSFSKLGYHEIEILELEKNEFLKSKLNLTYLRNGKLTKFVDDLQSFTLLRKGMWWVAQALGTSFLHGGLI